MHHLDVSEKRTAQGVVNRILPPFDFPSKQERVKKMTNEQRRKLLEAAAPSLLAACEAVFEAWSEKEKKAARIMCTAAIAEATIPLK